MHNFYLLLSKLKNPHYNQKNEYRTYITKLKKEYSDLLKELEDIKNRINRNRNTINTAYTARKCFKYKLPMTDKYAIPDLKRIVSYYEVSNQISPREAILCVLDIECHNKSVVSYRNGNKIEMMYSTLENAKPLRNTLLIYEAFKTKSDLAKNLDNLEIENTNLKLNARTTSLYTFDENTRYCNDIPLYISNNDVIINKVNKEIQPEKIKFTSEQLPDSIINKIENKNIFKKIFK